MKRELINDLKLKYKVCPSCKNRGKNEAYVYILNGELQYNCDCGYLKLIKLKKG